MDRVAPDELLPAANGGIDVNRVQQARRLVFRPRSFAGVE
jgi:hypothetical protein